jgi:hypothetical protein
MKLRIGSVMKATCQGLVILLVLFSACTSEKCTSPVDTGQFLMMEYFPLDEGDEWTWEIVAHDTIGEPFIDGDVNLGEPFIDTNGNGVFDYGEVYEDLSHNGSYDGPNDPWTYGIPYEDRNGDGKFDYPNGIWENGESFADLDGNGTCGRAFHLTLGLRTQQWDSHVVYLSGGYHYVMQNGNPDWDVLFSWRDVFSNDSLGLRWHGHIEPMDWFDHLGHMKPITIAETITRIGDSVSCADTSSPNYTWISILEGVEDVAVPAGAFKDCLRFKTIASGWVGNMAKYNGTSHRWYAKNVGLVRSEGPGQGEYWILKSASVGGTSYP